MKIALAIPVIGDVPGQAFPYHMVQAIEIGRLGTVAMLSPFNKFPHDVARNCAFREAIEHECDVLFFIDADTIVPIGAFPKLLATMQERKAVVVSGHYLRRGWPYTCVWSKELPVSGGKKTDYFQVDATAGVHEIDTSGFGCCLVDIKWVKDNMTAPWSEMVTCPIKGETVVSDDITFMKKVRDLGGLILGDADVRCLHLGDRQVVSSETADHLRQESLKLQAEGGKIPLAAEEHSDVTVDRSKLGSGQGPRLELSHEKTRHERADERQSA